EGVRALESAFARVSGERYPLAANDAAWPALDELRDALYQLENWLFANWHAALKHRPENDAEAERRRDLTMRVVVAHSAAIDRAQAPSDHSIAWIERGDADGRYSLRCAPYDVAEFLRATLFAHTPSVVLTSATIAPFEFLKRSLGIDRAQELIAPSPFDFDRQARLFVAPPALNPKSPEFAVRAAPLVE